MSRPKFLVFTGGCYSGKTTSMEVIKDILEAQGKKVVFLDELIRRHKIGSIDEIRRDPNKYMELQNDIIRGKMDSEKYSYNNFDENTIILVDRSVTDSLFYLTFYVDKNSLDIEHQTQFIKLFHDLNKYLEEVNNVYTYIFEFTPLKNLIENDIFRPQNLKELQNIEYEMIKKYNFLYFHNHDGYMSIDLNSISKDEMYMYWTNLLNSLNI